MHRSNAAARADVETGKWGRRRAFPALAENASRIRLELRIGYAARILG